MMKMNRACSIALLAGICANVAVAGTVNIDVRNNFFRVISAVPGQGTNKGTINVGDTVVWTWMGNFHSVTADDGSYDSGIQNQPFTFQHTFGSAGTYGYHCIVQGAPGVGMFGTTTVIVPGDYNNNGTVDAADYILWRKGGPLANEIDTPGTVNAADYTAWRSRFGNPGSGSGGGSNDSANAAVPEPAASVLLLFAAAGWCLRRRPATL